jgi:hypothetical protein
MPPIHCVSQGNDDDKGIHPSYRKEPDIKMSATLPRTND